MERDRAHALIRERRITGTSALYVLVVEVEREEPHAIFHLALLDLSAQDPEQILVRSEKRDVPWLDLKFSIRKLLESVLPHRLGEPPIFLDEPGESDEMRALRLVDCNLAPRKFDGVGRVTTYRKG